MLSLAGTYFNCIMFMVASSVVTTIMILNYHHRLADTHEMPNWVKVTINKSDFIAIIVTIIIAIIVTIIINIVTINRSKIIITIIITIVTRCVSFSSSGSPGSFA